MQCSIDKNTIRAQMKEKRSGLMSQERHIRSEEICKSFMALDGFKKAEMVCVYMSAFGEVDTSFIINECDRLGKTVAVPVVDGDDIYLCRFGGEMVKGAFGILEPAEKKLISIGDIDIFAVPGLAFDKCGGRVGFGKGYYDKLLFGAKAIKAALLYDFQLMEKVPCHEHDIMMDYLITERQVLCCGYDV